MWASRLRLVWLLHRQLAHSHQGVCRMCLAGSLPPPAHAYPRLTASASAGPEPALARRLNYRLNDACHDTITSKCGDACSSQGVEQPCGGTVLRCLTDKLDEITDEDCKKEVFYFIKMEVRDFRNDVILAEACRTDVDKHCANVEPGAPPAGCLALLGMDPGWPAGAWLPSA